MIQKHLLLTFMVILVTVRAGAPPVSGYTWIPQPAMQSNRTDHTATLVNGKFYLIGGCTAIGSGCNEVDGLGTLHESWNPETYALEILPNLTVPRYRHVAGAIGECIYVSGGRAAADVALDTFEIYNVTSRTWRVGPPFPDARSDSAAFVFNGLFYVYGGYDQNYTTLRSGYYYDPALNNWTFAGNLIQARGDLMAAIMNGTVFVAGGFDQYNATFYDEQKTVDFSRDGQTWDRLIPELLDGKGDGVLLNLRNNLLLIGGEANNADGSTVIATEVQVWRPPQTTWSPLTALPDERYRMAGGVYKDAAYLFGGHDSNQIPMNTVNKLVFSAASSTSISHLAMIFVVLGSIVLSAW